MLSGVLAAAVTASVFAMRWHGQLEVAMLLLAPFSRILPGTVIWAIAWLVALKATFVCP